jgi:hypothetical protein
LSAGQSAAGAAVFKRTAAVKAAAAMMRCMDILPY